MRELWGDCCEDCRGGSIFVCLKNYREDSGFSGVVKVGGLESSNGCLDFGRKG